MTRSPLFRHTACPFLATARKKPPSLAFSDDEKIIVLFWFYTCYCNLWINKNLNFKVMLWFLIDKNHHFQQKSIYFDKEYAKNIKNIS